MVEISQEKKPLVLITGVSGFVGSQVLNEFLQGEGKDKYRIRATVRDKNNQQKLKPLRDYFGVKLFAEVEFFSAELENQNQLDAAIEGCDFVIHTAAPVGGNPKNHEDMIRPSVNGNLNVLKAAQKNKVKRVVITSSISAIINQPPATDTHVYDENTWTDIQAADFTAYNKSKTLAEEAAWNFKVKQEMGGFYCPEIVMINPGYVFGETIGCGAQTTAVITKQMINNEMPGYPNIFLNPVDIKDVSKAHIRAMERPAAANKRFILCWEKGITMHYIATQLSEVLRENGYDYDIKLRELPTWVVKIGSWFSRDISSVFPMIDAPSKTFINTQSREVLGIEYKRSIKEILLESAESMMKSETIPVKRIKAKK